MQLIKLFCTLHESTKLKPTYFEKINIIEAEYDTPPM